MLDEVAKDRERRSRRVADVQRDPERVPSERGTSARGRGSVHG